jgi:spore coat protein U-like protein
MMFRPGDTYRAVALKTGSPGLYCSSTKRGCPRWLLLCVLLLSSLLTIPAHRSCAQNASLGARTRVVPAVWLSVSSLDFGEIESADVYEARAVITLRVARGVSYCIALDSGRHGGNGARWLLRRGGSERLKYEIFQDPAASQPWGDAGFEGTYPRGRSLWAVGTGRLQEFPVYGRLYTGAVIPALGEYVDVITVSLHY